MVSYKIEQKVAAVYLTANPNNVFVAGSKTELLK